jgi:hypothetical protein
MNTVTLRKFRKGDELLHIEEKQINRKLRRTHYGNKKD